MNIEIYEMIFDDVIAIEPNFSEKFDRLWSIHTLKNDFIEDHSKYIVAKVNNEIVGFAGIKIILDEADIMNIVTRVDKRGNGIGSLLLGNLINLASLLNCTCINLEVNENNDPAIHLYEKYSFARIGLRKKYYNNTDNAILMKKEL